MINLKTTVVKLCISFILIFCISKTCVFGEEQGKMAEKVKVYNYHFYTRKHHKQSGGFKNIYGRQESPSPLKAIKWLLGKIIDRGVSANTPLRKIDPREFEAEIKKFRIFWLGHSTTLIQFKSMNIMFDPNLNEFAGLSSFAGRKRLVEIPVNIDELPQIRAVLISHSHYDHLDKKTVVELEKRFSPLFFVPLRTGEILSSWGVKNIVEMDWWQYAEYGGLKISCVPAVHFSNRGLHDRDRILWAGWYVEDLFGGAKIYYSGDTAYGEHFKEIGERLGPPDLAILPIGAYEPRWFMKLAHINPEEAIMAFIDLKAREFLGVHWGTFKLSDEPVDEPPELVKKYAKENNISDERIHMLPVGGEIGE
jgi:L-ascorbate metabolism protein UlaG (beta-lactamase superfamily)